MYESSVNWNYVPLAFVGLWNLKKREIRSLLSQMNDNIIGLSSYMYICYEVLSSEPTCYKSHALIEEKGELEPLEPTINVGNNKCDIV